MCMAGAGRPPRQRTPSTLQLLVPGATAVDPVERTDRWDGGRERKPDEARQAQQAIRDAMTKAIPTSSIRRKPPNSAGQPAGGGCRGRAISENGRLQVWPSQPGAHHHAPGPCFLQRKRLVSGPSLAERGAAISCGPAPHGSLGVFFIFFFFNAVSISSLLVFPGCHCHVRYQAAETSGGGHSSSSSSSGGSSSKQREQQGVGRPRLDRRLRH